MGEVAKRFSVSVDQDLCMGSGYCVHAYPGLFGLDSDGIAELLQGDPPQPVGCGPMVLGPDQVGAVRKASDTCPAAAIHIQVDL